MSRSVEAVVADMVEKAARAGHPDFDGYPDAVQKALLMAHRQTIVAADVPALVEALAELFEATDPYYEDAAPGEELNGVWAQHFGALSHARVSALKALGGEQVQARADLTKIVTDVLDDPETLARQREYGDHIRRCQSSAQANEGHDVLAEQVQPRAELEADLRRIGDQLQSAASRMADYVEGGGEPSYEVRMARLEAESAIREWTALRSRQSSSPTPTTQKKGEHGQTA